MGVAYAGVPDGPRQALDGKVVVRSFGFWRSLIGAGP
jgi:hypothetical protein